MKETTFLRLISERLDPDELVDLLGLTTQELTLIFMQEIFAKREVFMDFLDFEEFSEE